jgi:predicted small metal-binding protein
MAGHALRPRTDCRCFIRRAGAGPAMTEATMKTMTCRELGGACDEKLSAGSWDEMVKTMTLHVMQKHPDVAKKMEQMHKDDPQKWGREMKPKWEAAKER